MVQTSLRAGAIPMTEPNAVQVLICDDDNQFLELIHSRIENYIAVQHIPAVIHAYDSIVSVPEDIMEYIDLAFLDIDFPREERSGIDLARVIRSIRHNAVILFVSNYIEYAPEGYEVQAFRYVLKNELPQKLETYITQAIHKLESVHQTMQVSIAGEKRTVLLSDILYIESQGHAVLFHLKGWKNYRIYASIGKVEQELESKGFLRIHKGFLVNMNHIQQFKSAGAVLTDGISIPVSAKNYSEQKKKFLLWKGRQ